MPGVAIYLIVTLGDAVAMIADEARPLFEAERKKTQGHRSDLCARMRTSAKGRASDDAAKAFGVSGRNVDK